MLPSHVCSSGVCTFRFCPHGDFSAVSNWNPLRRKSRCPAWLFAQAEMIPLVVQQEQYPGQFNKVRNAHYYNFAKKVQNAKGWQDWKKIPKCMRRLLRRVYQDRWVKQPDETYVQLPDNYAAAH